MFYITYFNVSILLYLQLILEFFFKITDIPIEAATFTVAWHPKQYLLAFACDDKEHFDRKRDTGNLKVFGFASD